MSDFVIESEGLQKWLNDTGPTQAAWLRREMARTTNGLAATGVGLAVQNAPIDTGALRASILVRKAATKEDLTAQFGSYGVEYAWQREEGGTIYARNEPYLVFEVNGHWVRTKSVFQKGSHFMKRAAEAVADMAPDIYRAAILRVFNEPGKY